MDDRFFLDECMEMSEDLDWFDNTFLQSLDEAFEKYGKLTENQSSALRNIFDMLCKKTHGSL